MGIQNRIKVIEGDITQQHVDAIVNAANRSLLGGRGVDGAIHQAAGPELFKECQTLGNCKTGHAKITKGYLLPAKWIIHTVGPVWQGGTLGEEELLMSCYRSSLQLAVQHHIHTLAFPAISTGAYRFPMDRATRVAAKEITRFLEQSLCPENVILVCFDANTRHMYQQAVDEVLRGKIG